MQTLLTSPNPTLPLYYESLKNKIEIKRIKLKLIDKYLKKKNVKCLMNFLLLIN